MAQSRSKSSEENLRGIIKQLKSQVRNLKKELARQGKREHLHADLEELEQEHLIREEYEDKNKEEVNNCPDCGSKLNFIDLGPRKMFKCSQCKYRKVKK